MSKHPPSLAIRALTVAVGLLALALPFYLDAFWLQLGVTVMGAIIGALGLNLLVGTAGQLSLAHGVFLAIGAYGYAYLAAAPSEFDTGASGLGVPPLLAAVLAVALTGLCGLVFAPVAGRLKGIYLGLASLALVFVAQHVLSNATRVTGGFNGRAVPEFEVLNFSFADDNPALVVLGVPFGGIEKLWYLALVISVCSALFIGNLTRSRAGRALMMVRDNEIAAGSMGISTSRYKAAAFVVSSCLAGTSGVVLSLAFQRVVPEYFDLLLSVNFLMMIVIGGLGSTVGASLGAAFVTALPLVLGRYSSSIPFLAEPGGAGIDPSIAAQVIFGVAVTLIILLEPGGLAALATRAREAVARKRRDPPHPTQDTLPVALTES